MDQFGLALSEIEDLKHTVQKQRTLLEAQEASVASYANTIEAVGHDVILRDKGRSIEHPIGGKRQE